MAQTEHMAPDGGAAVLYTWPAGVGPRAMTNATRLRDWVDVGTVIFPREDAPVSLER